MRISSEVELRPVKPRVPGSNPGCAAISTKLLGTHGELRVAADLLSRGYHVFTPIADASKSDLIATRDEKSFLRIQVKTMRTKNGAVSIGVVAKGKGNNKNRVYEYRYTKENVDYIAVFVYDRDCVLYIPIEAFSKNSLNIRFDPTKNNQVAKIRWATDYKEI